MNFSFIRPIYFKLADGDPLGVIRWAGRRGYIKLISYRVHKVSQNAGLSLMSSDDINNKKSDTLFILGSGGSIEDLTKQNFAEIARGYSVGVNNWPVHDFVPDAYSFETVDDQDKAAAISRCLNRAEVLAQSPLFLAKDSMITTSIENQVKIPPSLKDRLRIYTNIPVFTRKKNLLTKTISELFEGSQNGRFPSWLTIGQGASIERIASMGVYCGFKNIVFVGVDLNNTEYFWERNSSYLERRSISSLSSGQKGQVHKTIDPAIKRFPVTNIIEAMASAAWDIFGIKMWVANKESALADFLDVYSWDSAG